MLAIRSGMVVLSLFAQAPIASGAERVPPPAQMRPLGLIGGLAWYSTVDYYRYINKAVNDAYGDNTNPPLIVYNLNQQQIHALQARGDWTDIAAIMIAAARHLRAAGAQAVMFCANTPHKVYDQVAGAIDIPVLHIADATGDAIEREGLRKVGLIGTRYTMEDGFIADRLAKHNGIEVIVPESAADREELHRIIHEELDLGIFKPASKRFVLDQIRKLRKRGAQGIVLGCTEFPLIVKPADVSLPVFDTTLLHSQMAVDFILGRRSGKAEAQRSLGVH